VGNCQKSYLCLKHRLIRLLLNHLSRLTGLLPPPSSDAQVDGYHGTDRTSAAAIMGVRGFRTGCAKDPYLGNGVYFYEGSESAAWDWAAKHFVYGERVVLRALVKLGRCFDMLEPKFAELLLETMEKLRRQGTLPVNEAITLEWIAKQYQIDTIRALRHESKPLRQESVFALGGRLVICVVNVGNIGKVSVSKQDP
jgi:hypothetical protein